MAYSFNGSTKTITLSSGTTAMGVRDLWSRWVQWFLTSDNSKYPLAFSQVGGNDIDASAGTSIPIYAFLQNGWKVKPQEANHTLNVNDGILLVEGGGDPFANTAGSYIVRINYSQPVQAITVATGGGGGGGGATAADIWAYSNRTLTESAGLSTEEHNHLMKLRNGGGGALINFESIEKGLAKDRAWLYEKIEAIPGLITTSETNIMTAIGLVNTSVSHIMDSKDMENLSESVGKLAESTEEATKLAKEVAVEGKQKTERLAHTIETYRLEDEIKEETQDLARKHEKKIQYEVKTLETEIQIQDEVKNLALEAQIQDEVKALESNL